VCREVCEHLKVAPARVFAVPEAARECFTPMKFDETEGVRLRVGAGREFLLAVGTIEPRKNLPTLVAAFEEVVRARPSSPLRLVVAGGRGWMSEPVFETFEKSPARERITLAGYLGDRDLRALYSSCRAFVYPSVYEGFGLPPLEAMRCGAPVVVGRATAVAEVTGGAARLVNPLDASELARVLLELLDDEGARRELSQAGLRRATEFSWERTARATLEVYAEALKRKKGTISGQ
jgi:glycosyltransferase involved in cell wall biosynthesis